MFKTLRLGRRLAFIVVTAILCLTYAQQVTVLNKKTYIIAELSKKRDRLSAEVQRLAIQEAEAKSIYQLRKTAAKDGLVPITNVTYVSSPK